MQAVDLPQGAKLCPGKSASGTHGPMTWRSIRRLGDFGFIVDHVRYGRVHVSALDLDNAPKAEAAAAAWCAAWKEPADPVETRGPAHPDDCRCQACRAEEEAGHKAEQERHAANPPVFGWRIEVSPEPRPYGEDDSFRAALFAEVTGAPGPVTSGHATADGALKVARLWASWNPCDGGAALPVCPEPDCLGVLQPGTAGDLGTRDFCSVCGWTAPIEHAEPTRQDELEDDALPNWAEPVGPCSHEYEGDTCHLCGAEGPTVAADSDDASFPIDPDDPAGLNEPYPDHHPDLAGTGCDGADFSAETEADALRQAEEWAIERLRARRRLASERAAAAARYRQLRARLALAEAEVRRIEREMRSIADATFDL